jgi:hypothetical protein
MRKIIGSALVLAGLGLAALSYAQTTVAVDISKAKLAWSWSQGSGSAATQFIVKCGTTTGVYTKITSLTDVTARSVPISTAIAGPGTWFCVVTAANQFGESAPTNEVSFNAGSIPVSATSLTVQAQ